MDYLPSRYHVTKDKKRDAACRRAVLLSIFVVRGSGTEDILSGIGLNRLGSDPVNVTGVAHVSELTDCSYVAELVRRRLWHAQSSHLSLGSKAASITFGNLPRTFCWTSRPAS
jgi:hypothetical protein